MVVVMILVSFLFSDASLKAAHKVAPIPAIVGNQKLTNNIKAPNRSKNEREINPTSTVIKAVTPVPIKTLRMIPVTTAINPQLCF